MRFESSAWAAALGWSSVWLTAYFSRYPTPARYAWILGMWLLVSGLVWSVGAIVVGERSHFAALVRCLGFAYAWFVLFIGYELPWIGGLFGLAAFGLTLLSNALAVRAVMSLSLERAVALCLGALFLPMALLYWLF